MTTTTRTLQVSTLMTLAVAIGVAGLPALAQSQPAPNSASQRQIKTVLELFTSQGCSSCPRADGLMESTYSKRPDVLALSFSVDYWDYIGWKDTNASPRNTARQRDYARTRGDGAVYTPQMVVNGRAHVVGSQGADIDRAVLKAPAAGSGDWVQLTIRSDASGITIDTPAASKPVGQDARLILVGVKRRHDMKIERGENAGRSITYTNVVREFKTIATWTGTASTVAITPDQLTHTTCDAYAILLQRGPGGPIIGATTIGVW
jgi:hypothetical protein